MTIISCPECKNSVSDAASACVHCGYSYKTKTGIGENLTVGCLSFLIITFLILCVMGGGFDDRRPAPPREAAFNNHYDSSVVQVVVWLKNNIRDPGSLQFIEWSEVKKVESGFVVRVKYRAKNGFGGYVVEHKLFGMDLNGTVLGCEDIK